MTFRRLLPETILPSILLLRAIAARREARFAVVTIAPFTKGIGMRVAEVAQLIRWGSDAGFVRNDPHGTITPMERGG